MRKHEAGEQLGICMCASADGPEKAKLEKPDSRQQQAPEGNTTFDWEEKMETDEDLKVVRTYEESLRQGYATKEDLQRQSVQGVLVQMETQGARARMEELSMVIKTIRVLQTQGKVEGKGHEEMELKLEIEDAPLDEEEDRLPALIAAEGGSNNEKCVQVHRLEKSRVWTSGMEKLALQGRKVWDRRH